MPTTGLLLWGHWNAISILSQRLAPSQEVHDDFRFQFDFKTIYFNNEEITIDNDPK